jgi:wyosine [tRNA(Phe)-imidazoG37] synthetase (radical SAM superfamily)
MATFLFDKIVFGPVKSRRLGVSLGINLLPLNCKLCNFDCIYCECGFTLLGENEATTLPTREEVYRALKIKLYEMRTNNEILDVITFAGNGEPTIHPLFPDIINDTVQLRNSCYPSAAISVLSNSTMLDDNSVVEALKKVDQNILKLDSGLLSTILTLNRPIGEFDLMKLIHQLKQFDGKLIIQSMFVSGDIDGKQIDNTSEEDLQSWVAILKEVNPQEVMIYTIDRDTPYKGLKKVPVSVLNSIASRVKTLGIKVKVSE